MKAVKLVLGLAVIIAPLVWFIESQGLAFRQNGGSWLPFVLAPVQAAIVALLASGLPGKKVVGTDDQGMPFFGRFWAIFSLLTLALSIFAFILKAEA